MNNEKNKFLEQQSDEIVKLLQRSESSGKAAFRIGEILYEIKSNERYKNEYKNFVLQKIRISDSKASVYISIYTAFEDRKDSLSDNDNMLVTHLELLSKLPKEQTALIFKAIVFLEQSEIYNDSRNDQNIRPSYETGDLEALKNIAQICEVKDQKDVNNILLEIYKSRKEEEKEEKAKKKELKKLGKLNNSEPFYHGNKLKCTYFCDLSNLIDHEPIDEQSLVGLFCVLFHLIAQESLLFSLKLKDSEEKDSQYCFSSFYIIRQSYPDAVINIRNIRNKRLTPINVEFEFRSSRFIRHEHLDNSDIKCHLIICWEDDIKNSTLEKYLNKIRDSQRFPKILSVKDLLETGKIELT